MRVHVLAEQDLIRIWEYSFAEWGTAHADAYLEHIDRCIQSLSRNPRSGLQRDHVRKGYRGLFVKRHAVYYIVGRSFVQVVRVLHAQMDPGVHL